MKDIVFYLYADSFVAFRISIARSPELLIVWLYLNVTKCKRVSFISSGLLGTSSAIKRLKAEIEIVGDNPAKCTA